MRPGLAVAEERLWLVTCLAGLMNNQRVLELSPPSSPVKPPLRPAPQVVCQRRTRCPNGARTASHRSAVWRRSSQTSVSHELRVKPSAR
jgi:hypothetical protein